MGGCGDRGVEIRLADVSGIDLNDFRFDQDPPIGGTDTSADVDSEQVDIENAIVAIEHELALRESEISAVDFLLSRKHLQYSYLSENTVGNDNSLVGRLNSQ